MVDILAIGSGAVNAYRQALSTTSNNIANVNTPGYSRRALSIGESFPVQEGIFSFGTGAQAEAIVRAYDEFVERSLRDATSDLEVNEPVVEYANRIIDLTASEDASLSNAFDNFFNAAQQLSTEPRSVPLRTEFLNTAEIVAARFNDLSLQIDRIAEESSVALEQSVSELNALTAQLRKVNEELNRKDSVNKQPPGLLDQRDILLRDISALVKVGVTEFPNGQVQVNFGGVGRGFEIVTRTDDKPIAIVSAGDASVAGMRLVLDPYGVNRALPSAPSGRIGGALNLNTEVLRPIRTGLDHLAREFASQMNSIHREGLDADGDFGGDLFRTTTSFVPSLQTAAGAISAAVQVVDQRTAPTEALELVYRAGTETWDIYDSATKDLLGELPHGVENYQTLGMSFTLAGEPINGDLVVFAPKDRPARTFELLVNDSSRVATGASMRYMPGTNSKDIAVTLQTIPEEERPVGFEFGYQLSNLPDKTHVMGLTLSADERRPAIQVSKGTTGADILFDIERDSDQHIQILTRERMHIAGTQKLTPTAGNQLTKFDAGFGQGAYNQQYFDKRDDDAFLNTNIDFGVRSQARTEILPAVDPDTGSLTDLEVVKQANIVSKTLSPFLSKADGTKLIADGALKISTVHYSASANSGSGGNVTTDLSLGDLVIDKDERLSAAVARDYFNQQLKSGNLKNVVASAETFITASNIDLSKELEINGHKIAFEPKAGIGNLVSQINKQSELTKVRAQWLDSDSIQLTNTVGHEGENIDVASSDADETEKGLNTLGLSAGTYSGTYRLDALGETRDEVTSRFFTAKTQQLNNGSQFDIELNLDSGTETVTVNTDTPQGVVDAINNASVGVTAALVEDVGDTPGFRITLDDGGDNDFKVASDISFVESGYNFPNQDLGFNDKRNRSTGLNKPSEISLTLADGVPADLGAIGLATGVLFDGDVPDDLAIFLTGTGSAQATVRAEQDAASAAPAEYPADAFKVEFDSSGYEIVDVATNTILAVRAFTISSDGVIPDIEYQGIRLRFSEAPVSGDSFTIEPNKDGVGSNETILRIIELGKEDAISGQTFSDAYLDLIAGVGGRAQLAELSKDAMEVVRDQAQASREAAVGVNLDEEAADLIRFQQAYQAAAQVIQISQRLFDTLIQAS